MLGFSIDSYHHYLLLKDFCHHCTLKQCKINLNFIIISNDTTFRKDQYKDQIIIEPKCNQ